MITQFRELAKRMYRFSIETQRSNYDLSNVEFKKKMVFFIAAAKQLNGALDRVDELIKNNSLKSEYRRELILAISKLQEAALNHTNLMSYRLLDFNQAAEIIAKLGNDIDADLKLRRR